PLCRPLSDEAIRRRRLSSITRAPCRKVIGGAPCNGSLNFTEPTLGFFARFPVSNETRVYPNGSQVDQGVASKAQPEPEGEMEETETPADPEAPLFLIR